jgi:hypothetical protein
MFPCLSLTIAVHETLCHALGTMQRIENFRPCPDGPMSMPLIRWVSLDPGAAGLCTPNAKTHLPPEAGATQERTLEAVRCSAWLDAQAIS